MYVYTYSFVEEVVNIAASCLLGYRACEHKQLMGSPTDPNGKELTYLLGMSQHLKDYKN